MQMKNKSRLDTSFQEAHNTMAQLAQVNKKIVTHRITAKPISDEAHEKKVIDFMRSVQFILASIGTIEVEWQMYMVDYKFKNANMNNHLKRMRESMREVKRHFANFVQVKDQDEFSYEYTVQLHRVMALFSGLHTDQLAEYADGLEELLANTTESHEKA